MRHFKSLPHQIKNIAASEILNSNAPSIFEVDDFFTEPSTSTEVSASTAASTTGGTSAGTPQPQTNAPVNQGSFATLADLVAHTSDDLAHKTLFDNVYTSIEQQIGSIVDITNSATELSGTVALNTANIAGLSGTLSDFIGLVEDEYLRADNLDAGDNIAITAGTDGLGRPTRSIALNIEKGVINGSINGVTAGPFSAGVDFETGRVVNATLSNLSVTTAALTVSSVTNNGSDIQFYVNSGYSGTTVNSSFQIHWTMI